MAEKLYLYLARRDKKAIKIISVLKGEATPRKITSVKQMGLSPELTEEIDAIIYDNRILWETWMQSAEDFSTLKENLTKRGYNNLPTHASPIHAKTRHKKEETKLPAEKPKTMLRKKT